MIPVADVEELYASAVNGAASLEETRHREGGDDYRRAFELLKIIAEGPMEPAEPMPSLRGWGWVEFEPVLTDALSRLGEDSYLILPVKFERTFVQFAGQGAFGMRVEASSNSVLPPHSQLSEAQLGRMVELGWRRPTGSLHASNPLDDPHGSPNFFMEFDAPVDFAAVARLAIDTFVEVLQVPYPNDLTYDAFGPDGPLELTALKLTSESRRAPEPETPDDVRDKLREVLRQLLPPGHDAEDENGNFSIGIGDHPVHLLVMRDTPGVRVISPVQPATGDRNGTLTTLNELNRRFRFASLVLNGESILAVEDVRADPFDWQSLHRAVTGVLRAVEQSKHQLQKPPPTFAPPTASQTAGYL